MRRRSDIDLAVTRLADAQHGVVARRQLLAAGWSTGVIDRRLRRRWLRQLHHGVYALGHRQLKADGHRLAAVLACGPTAILSHASAAAHWGLRPSSATRSDVIVRTGAGLGRPGIRVHRCTSVLEREVTVHRAAPITTPARTLLDLAATLAPRAVERALDQAEVLRLFDLDDLRRVVAAHRGRPGAPLLAALIETGEAGSSLTRSELEDAFLALCNAHRIARPRVNARVQGFEVDFHWPGSGLVVEVDGFAFHRTRRAFERDRRRDAVLASAGLRTQRFTERQIVERPEEVVRALARSLLS